MTAEELYRECVATLSPVLGAGEGRAAADIIFEDVRGMNRTAMALYGHRTLEDFTVSHIRDIVASIAAGMPVQYAVGTARFCGIDFIVTPAVLIPRPETQWLVDRISDDAKGRSDLRILDCGTGSGCIAISLARALPFASVEAIDISPDALDVARRNAEKTRTSVKFRLQSIFDLKAPQQPCYDIIVSNPPYIAESERPTMDERVYAREPELALFVPDSDPLRFYRAIAEYAVASLEAGGRLYFEINPRYADDMRRMLDNLGFEDIDICRDFAGMERYAVAKKARL